MKKIVSCFECGYKYDRKREARCFRCGEEKIFDPRLHDENYDIARDPSRSGKYLIVSTLVLFAIFSIMIIKGWKSIAIQGKKEIMLILTLVLATSSILGMESNPPQPSAKPNIAIVDMGGGGGFSTGTDGRFCSRGHSKC